MVLIHFYYVESNKAFEAMLNILYTQKAAWNGRSCFFSFAFKAVLVGKSRTFEVEKWTVLSLYGTNDCRQYQHQPLIN